MVERAVLALEARRSISAKIRQRVHLFGKPLIGSGIYLEQRSSQGLQFRLELKIQAGDQSSSLLQVCDGSYLWTYRKGPQDSGSLSRISVLRAMEAVEEMGGTSLMADGTGWKGLGGLPRLLRGLHASFAFLSVEHGQLEQAPVWKLTGQWKPNKVAALLPDQATAAREGRAVQWSKLPPHLPDHVVLYLGKENLFPYRVEYCRFEPNPKDQNRYPVPSDRVLVAVEIFDVAVNVPIPDARFSYNPGNLEFTDQTEAYLQSLRRKE